MRRVAITSLLAVAALGSSACAAVVGLDEDYYVVEHGAPCSLTDSGPVTATVDGQVIERLRITSTSGHALRVEGFANVVIRDCEILHSGGHGIYFTEAPGLRIERVRVEHTDAPEKGPNDAERNNVDGHDSAHVTMKKLELVKGSTGVYLENSPSAILSEIEGYDFRGPSPRGQLVQFLASDDGLLEDFSCISDPDTSWPQENVSSQDSNDVTIRRGLLQGNNSPSWSAVQFIQTNGATGGTVEEVDTIDQGDGSFAAYPASSVTFLHTRARSNHCTSQADRGAPCSGGTVWIGNPDSQDLKVVDSNYYDLCDPNKVYWDPTVFTTFEATAEDFVPRPAIDVTFCWQ